MAIPTRHVVAATVSGKDFKAHCVQDPATRSVLDAVRKLSLMSPTAPFKYPGPLPVSLERADVSRMKTQDYVVCEKTDGARFALVCLVHAVSDGSNLKIVALVGRKGDVYLFPLQHVPKAMYQGTVLDGELAFDKHAGRFTYVIFDALTVSGVSVGHLPLYDRLRVTHEALTHYKAHPKDPATVMIKSYVSLRAPALVRQHLDSVAARFDVDGVVFTPTRDEVRFGRHRGLFKLKTKHTVDFLVGRDGELQVFDHARRSHVSVGKLMGPSPGVGAIVECTHMGLGDPAMDLWTLLHVRSDKTTANDVETYERTMLNMRENLTLDQVLA